MSAIPSDLKPQLAKIVCQATFISERLSHQTTSTISSPFNEEIANTRFNHWCKVSASGDWDKFYKRLEWNGWSCDTVLRVLGTELEPETYSLPSWALTLAEIIETVVQLTQENLEPLPRDSNDPKPFEDVFLPLVLVGRQKLLARLGVESLSDENLPLKRLEESAYLSLEDGLYQRLFYLLVKTLDFEFSHSRPLGKNLLNLIIPNNKTTSGNKKYLAFVDKLLSDGFLGFFQKYPVLGRFIATTIDFWVESTAEFLERLENDLLEIKGEFSQINDSIDSKISENQLGKIKEIKPDLSDLHHQGRSVIVLTFASGLKLVYKPKKIGVDIAFNQLLSWLNQQLENLESSAQSPLKILRILDKQTYGWSEYIEQKPCQDTAAAKRFYLQAGRLLCLLYFLGANDFHHENLIAYGDQLVMIDLETIMHHEAKWMEDSEDETAGEAAMNQLSDSVLRTALLPTWEFNIDTSVAYDVSGLGSIDIQPMPVPFPVWKSINTDDMYLAQEKIDRPLQANVPMLNSQPLYPNDYLKELITGFEQVYRFLIEQKENLLAANGPLSPFQTQVVRFLFRSTKVYGAVLNKTRGAEFLKHGLEWSIEADILSRAFLNNQNKPQAWPILEMELQAISLGDVPYFSAATVSDDLNLGGEQTIPEYFKGSCFNQVEQRLKRMNETDLAQQSRIIQLAFQSKITGSFSSERSKIESKNQEEITKTLLTGDQFVTKAIEIAQEIEDQGIIGSDGSLSWISLAFVPKAERFQLQPLGESFYDGNCGVAVFFAALARVTGDSKFEKLSLKSLQSLQSFLQNADAEAIKIFADNFGIGGGVGLGAIIYCLVKIRQFLDLPHLSQEAQKVAQFMSQEIIDKDTNFDIVKGAAGTVLSLLALYQDTGTNFVLDKAQACGQHLLKFCDLRYNEKSDTYKPLTGFSHGAAGIAYALLRLYEVTQDSAYSRGAQQAIAYENSKFFQEFGNWRQIIPTEEPSAAPVFWSTWCYGAPGIGLGRLGGLSSYKTEEILANIEAALKTTQETPLQQVDHLCCGNLGRCEVMWVAAHTLSNPQWYSAAQELASRVVNRASQTGKYELFADLPTSVFNPCFFQGLSGIGYQFLRLAHPKSLPSVLLWE
ncbi:type 2 lantipeptide synthetase LanM [Microcystis flos-aquae FACHB-1344]|uniref:Type 2 lantipeptide synthetase LanM n=1 Tax=Microcystis flos-aquae FACHB-1344 TaxID=2692899 RepID=A0ABR8HQR0_9CHRO|nr:type 2 lantipeptide synthetase LanM [Microcystis flos-aquae FACHB-1344]